MSTYPIREDEPTPRLRLIDPKATYDAEPRKCYMVTRSIDVERTILGTLGASAFGVYAFIDGYCNTEQRSWVSVPTIAKGVQLSERQVQRLLRDLEVGGWIAREETKNQFGFVTGITFVLTNHTTPSDKTGDIGGDIGGDITPPQHVTQGNTRGNTEVTKSGARKRATTLPDDFTLTEKRRAYAIKEGIAPEDVAREFQQFRNRNEAKGTTYKDWDAAWRTWVGNAVKWAAERRPRQAADERSISDRLRAYGSAGRRTEAQP